MIGGVLGGLAGAIAFGAITGAGTVSRWLVVLTFGGLLGAVFAGLPQVRRWAERSLLTGLGVGVLWGVVWWVPGLLVYPWRSITAFAAWGLFVGALYDITRRVAASSRRSRA